MRVLYWVERFLPSLGGVELLSAGLLPALRELGHECTVFTSNRKDEGVDRWEYRGIPVYEFPFCRAMRKKDLKSITTTLRGLGTCIDEIQPELLHVHFSGAEIFFQQQSMLRRRVPSVLTIHPMLASIRHLQTSDRSLLNRALGTADWIVTVSQGQLEEMHEIYPATLSCSSAIVNGLPMPEADVAPIPFDPPHVLCLGRMTRQKGFDLAVNAFEAVIEHVPDARLLLAGDGEERPALERMVDDLDLGSQVEFLGWTPPEELPSVINRATLLVVPSRWAESFGLVAVEGAQLARPVVATRLGGLAEIVVDGETGRLVPQDDAVALARAIVEIILDPEAARSMGLAGRRRARKRFSVTRVATEYDALYRRIANQNSYSPTYLP